VCCGLECHIGHLAAARGDARRTGGVGSGVCDGYTRRRYARNYVAACWRGGGFVAERRLELAAFVEYRQLANGAGHCVLIAGRAAWREVGAWAIEQDVAARECAIGSGVSHSLRFGGADDSSAN